MRQSTHVAEVNERLFLGKTQKTSYAEKTLEGIAFSMRLHFGKPLNEELTLEEVKF